MKVLSRSLDINMPRCFDEYTSTSKLRQTTKELPWIIHRPLIVPHHRQDAPARQISGQQLYVQYFFSNRGDDTAFLPYP